MLVSFRPPTVELFLPHIAVAFGFAPTFSHAKALAFTLDELFKPNFGPDLSVELLKSLQEKVEGTCEKCSSIVLLNETKLATEGTLTSKALLLDHLNVPLWIYCAVCRGKREPRRHRR